MLLWASVCPLGREYTCWWGPQCCLCMYPQDSSHRSGYQCCCLPPDHFHRRLKRASKSEQNIKVIKDYRAQQGITFVKPSLSYLIKIISNDLYNNIVLYTMKPIQMIPFSLYLQIIPVDLGADIS